MNYFEARYARLAQRVKKIKANPDPNKLKSTAMYYELEMDRLAHDAEAWKEGRPFCWWFNPPLAAAMGLQLLYIDSEADRVTDVDRYFDILRVHGYPDHHCDRSIIGVAMVLAGDVPLPALTVSLNATCDPIMLMGHAIGKLSPHHFCIDVDTVQEGPNERHLKYVTRQLEEFIEFAESRIPGVKYNEDRLAELIEVDRQAQRCVLDIYELRKRSPCPVSAQDVFRVPYVPSYYPYPEKAVEYYRTLRDEIAERAEKGLGGMKEEKVRIMWTTTAPFFTNVFKILEDLGASVVHSQQGNMARMLGIRGYYGDEKEFGRKLTPLEEMAREHTEHSWAGPGKVWVDHTIRFSKELRVDGIVHFEQWGCVAAVLTRKVMQDRVEAELGIPNLFIEGRMQDRSTFKEDDMRERLTHFVNICIERKAQRNVAIR